MGRKKKGGNSYEKEKTCKLCYENVALDRFCGKGHYFCSVCIGTWKYESEEKGLEFRCPVCRRKYDPREPIDIDNAEYGQYRYSMGFVDAPVHIGLVKKYRYGDCCTPCKQSMCDKVFCERPTCRGCIKNASKEIVGIDNQDVYCKKDGYGHKNNGGGKKKRRRRSRKKKRRKSNLKKRTKRRRRSKRRRRR